MDIPDGTLFVDAYEHSEGSIMVQDTFSGGIKITILSEHAGSELTEPVASVSLSKSEAWDLFSTLLRRLRD